MGGGGSGRMQAEYPTRALVFAKVSDQRDGCMGQSKSGGFSGTGSLRLGLTDVSVAPPPCSPPPYAACLCLY